MESRTGQTAVSTTNPSPANSPPDIDDRIVVSRQYLEQLHRHVRLGYERFPTRHLRQSLLILDHILIRCKR